MHVARGPGFHKKNWLDEGKKNETDSLLLFIMLLFLMTHVKKIYKLFYRFSCIVKICSHLLPQLGFAEKKGGGWGPMKALDLLCCGPGPRSLTLARD